MRPTAHRAGPASRAFGSQAGDVDRDAQIDPDLAYSSGQVVEALLWVGAGVDDHDAAAASTDHLVQA